MIRASTSLIPPPGKGTLNFTVRVGNGVWEKAELIAKTAKTPAAHAATILFTLVSLSSHLCKASAHSRASGIHQGVYARLRRAMGRGPQLWVPAFVGTSGVEFIDAMCARPESRLKGAAEGRLALAESGQLPHARAAGVFVGADMGIDEIGPARGERGSQRVGEIGRAVDVHALDAGGTRHRGKVRIVRRASL